MIGDLNISALATFRKQSDTRQASSSVGDTGILISVSGKYSTSGRWTATSGDTTLPLGDVGAIGFLALKNLQNSLIDTPAAPTVTNVGTGGAVTYTYKIVAKQADGGYTIASSGGSTATGNATLDGTNYNHLTWPAIDDAVSYDVYLTVGGTTGFLANVTTNSYDDQSGSGDGASAPSTTPYDFDILFGYDGSNYPILLRGGDDHVVRLNSALVSDIHCIQVSNDSDFEFLIVEA